MTFGEKIINKQNLVVRRQELAFDAYNGVVVFRERLYPRFPYIVEVL